MHSQEEHPRDLLLDLGHRLLKENHAQTGQEDKEPVTKVTEHDGEKERECDDGEEAWVDLLVRANAVVVHKGLEALGELVDAIESRRLFRSPQLLQNRGHVRLRGFLGNV